VLIWMVFRTAFSKEHSLITSFSIQLSLWPAKSPILGFWVIREQRILALDVTHMVHTCQKLAAENGDLSIMPN